MKFKNMKKFLIFSKKKEKNKIIFLFIFMGFASLLELLGLSMILPISSLFISNEINNNELINFILETFSMSKENLIYFFVLLFTIIYLFKIIFLIFISWYEQSFLNNFKFNLSNKFFKNYIGKDYSFLLEKFF